MLERDGSSVCFGGLIIDFSKFFGGGGGCLSKFMMRLHDGMLKYSAKVFFYQESLSSLFLFLRRNFTLFDEIKVKCNWWFFLFFFK